MTVPTQLNQLCINTLRFLSVDMVQKGNSGHPGLPLGATPKAYVLPASENAAGEAGKRGPL
jgi:transketolase